MEIKDLKLLKTLLLQYKRSKNDGWIRSDIDLVLESVTKDINGG
ncbi:hypothetical protein [Lederbergia lenta]|nr:hypothetical protein [Lederbergia lenta]